MPLCAAEPRVLPPLGPRSGPDGDDAYSKGTGGGGGASEPLLYHTPVTERDIAAKQEVQRASTGTVWGSIVNLAATSMGAGVLSLPVALLYGGWVLGTILMVVFSLLCDLSLLMLVRARRASGRASLEDIAEYYYGRPGRVLVKVSLVAILFGGCAVLLLVATELVSPAALYFVTGHVYSDDCGSPCGGMAIPWWAGVLDCTTCGTPPMWGSRAVVAAVLVGAIFPLTLPTNLSALSFTSTAAVLAILFVAGAVIAKFALGHVAPSAEALMVRPNMLMGMSIQGLAMCNQFNIIGVHDELPPAKRASIGTIIHVSMLGLVMPIYLAAGLAGYLLLGSTTPGNILNGFADTDTLMLAASLAVALTNVLKYPLITAPLRDAVNEMLGYTVYKQAAATGQLKHVGFFMRAAQMLLLCCSALVVALALKSLSLGFQVIGSTAGVAISFVLPGMLGFAALRHEARKAAASTAIVASGQGDVEHADPFPNPRGRSVSTGFTGPRSEAVAMGRCALRVHLVMPVVLLVMGAAVCVTGIAGIVSQV